MAALVARALSNRQIAGHLVITERTAETHIRDIRERLGFPTRTRVAAWAVVYVTGAPGD